MPQRSLTRYRAGLTVASKYFVLTLAFELLPTPGHLPLAGGQQSNVNLTVQRKQIFFITLQK